MRSLGLTHTVTNKRVTVCFDLCVCVCVCVCVVVVVEVSSYVCAWKHMLFDIN